MAGGGGREGGRQHKVKCQWEKGRERVMLVVGGLSNRTHIHVPVGRAKQQDTHTCTSGQG